MGSYLTIIIAIIKGVHAWTGVDLWTQSREITSKDFWQILWHYVQLNEMDMKSHWPRILIADLIWVHIGIKWICLFWIWKKIPSVPWFPDVNSSWTWHQYEVTVTMTTKIESVHPSPCVWWFSITVSLGYHANKKRMMNEQHENIDGIHKILLNKDKLVQCMVICRLNWDIRIIIVRTCLWETPMATRIPTVTWRHKLHYCSR